MMTIAGVGGTGLIGSQLMRRLSHAGHDPITPVRSTGLAIANGPGLARGLADASVANVPASAGK